MVLVLADTSEDYLSALEYKFLSEIGENVDVELFSDENCFREYFSQPRTAEIVLVSENMYFSELQKHNIANLFVLTETEGGIVTENLTVQHIFKYKSIKEIYFEATEKSRKELKSIEGNESRTKLISFYSASGGTGKTLLSLSFAAGLAAAHQNVLYINAESIQNFRLFFSDIAGLSMDGIRVLLQDRKKAYQNIKPYLKKEGFKYLPSVLQHLDSWGLTSDIYRDIALGAVESGEYQFVIVDIGTGLTGDFMKILEESDKVMVVTNTSRAALEKLRIWLDNVQLGDTEKYLLLYNRYDRETGIKDEMEVISGIIPYREFIPELTEEPECLKDLSEIREIRNLVYMNI